MLKIVFGVVWKMQFIIQKFGVEILLFSKDALNWSKVTVKTVQHYKKVGTFVFYFYLFVASLFKIWVSVKFGLDLFLQINPWISLFVIDPFTNKNTLKCVELCKALILHLQLKEAESQILSS